MDEKKEKNETKVSSNSIRVLKVDKIGRITFYGDDSSFKSVKYFHLGEVEDWNHSIMLERLKPEELILSFSDIQISTVDLLEPLIHLCKDRVISIFIHDWHTVNNLYPLLKKLLPVAIVSKFFMNGLYVPYGRKLPVEQLLTMSDRRTRVRLNLNDCDYLLTEKLGRVENKSLLLTLYHVSYHQMRDFNPDCLLLISELNSGVGDEIYALAERYSTWIFSTMAGRLEHSELEYNEITKLIYCLPYDTISPISLLEDKMLKVPTNCQFLTHILLYNPKYRGLLRSNSRETVKLDRIIEFKGEDLEIPLTSCVLTPELESNYILTPINAWIDFSFMIFNRYPRLEYFPFGGTYVRQNLFLRAHNHAMLKAFYLLGVCPKGQPFTVRNSWLLNSYSTMGIIAPIDKQIILDILALAGICKNREDRPKQKRKIDVL